jgi:hypothetical protein
VKIALHSVLCPLAEESVFTHRRRFPLRSTPTTANFNLSTPYPYFPISIFDSPRKSIVSPTSTRPACNPFVSPTSAKTGGYPPSIPNPRSSRYGSPSALCPLFPPVDCRLSASGILLAGLSSPLPRPQSRCKRPQSIPLTPFPTSLTQTPQGTLTLCSTPNARADHGARATDHGPLRTGRWQLVAGHRPPKFPMYPIGKFDASNSTVSRPQP